ncbi:MAG: insulinase family protein [Gemmatimonadales bacterium]|nr:insulinase family protein [Gemmatimonadales bacterium]
MRANSFLWCLLLTAGGVARAQAQTTTSFEYERFQLANGLDVLLHRLAHVPVVTVMTTYRVGSANERAGRSGFAHLFEHLMFKGSRHVPAGKLAEWLVEAGGGANGATSNDITVYATWAGSHALELALYLDAERMGFLLDGITGPSLDVERDVVKNERRERVDNAPYGSAFVILNEAVYGKQHPYSWPPIGSMADLTAASLDDVTQFYKTYYAPNNAQLVIVGDIDLRTTRGLVEKWYGPIPRAADPPPIVAAPPRLDGEVRLRKEESVQLARLYMAWPTPPVYAAGDAALNVIASLLANRIRQRLVTELQVAQNVTAFQESRSLASGFYLTVTAKPGQALDLLEREVRQELRRLHAAPPDARDVTRIVNGIESNLLSGIEATGGRADRISSYLRNTGMPDYFDEDLARYRTLTPRDLTDAAQSFLPLDRRVVLSIVPNGKAELAATNSAPVRTTP